MSKLAMPFLPVALRELTVVARKTTTHHARVASAGIALIIAFVLIASAHTPVRLGPQLLNILTLILFIEALLAGVRYTSDCISEEKRQGTLGLLFLTNLRGFDVIAGKIAGRALGAAYNLLAVIPIFGLSLLFGGVTGQQVAALSLVLITTMFLSLASGTLVSTIGFQEKNVLFATAILTAAFAFLPPIVWEAARAVSVGQAEWLLTFSPVYAFNQAAGGLGPNVLRSCGIIAFFTMVMFGFSSIYLHRAFTADPPLEAKTTGKDLRPARTPPRVPLLRLNPFYWLMTRQHSRFLTVIFPIIALAFGFCCRLVFEQNVNRMIPVAIFGSYGLHAFFKLLAAAESIRQLNADTHSGALELVLTTSLPPGLLIGGHHLATVRLFRPAQISLVLMNLAWMTQKEIFREIPLFIPCSIALLFADVHAIRWHGMIQALRRQRYPATVMRTFLQVIGIPILLLVLTYFIFARSLNREAANIIICTWTAACLVYDLTLVQKAKNKLRHFRALVAGDNDKRPG